MNLVFEKTGREKSWESAKFVHLLKHRSLGFVAEFTFVLLN